MLIGVAGMVGTGKTTLSRALAARFGLQMALESVDADNPWLESFYGGPDEMRAYALHLQLHFLATRFASMRRMRGLGGSWVLDRTWYEDAEIFARGLFEQGLMTSDEWTLYRRLYAELLHSPAARPPRLLIYLHAPLDVDRRAHRDARPAEGEGHVAPTTGRRCTRDTSVDRGSSAIVRCSRSTCATTISSRDPSAIEDIAAACASSSRVSCRRRSCGRRRRTRAFA